MQQLAMKQDWATLRCFSNVFCMSRRISLTVVLSNHIVCSISRLTCVLKEVKETQLKKKGFRDRFTFPPILMPVSLCVNTPVTLIFVIFLKCQECTLAFGG